MFLVTTSRSFTIVPCHRLRNLRNLRNLRKNMRKQRRNSWRGMQRQLVSYRKKQSRRLRMVRMKMVMKSNWVRHHISS
jgi:hypothetical protein